ncbi:MAG: hypothetical protein EOP54_28905, partial [Sphingobacteriales bacterium]
MKNIINKTVVIAGLVLGLLVTLLSCDDGFDNTGFEVNVPVSITSFAINGTEGVINQGTGQITVTMPYGSSITAAVPQVGLPQGAEANVDFSTAFDFSAPLEFRVTNGNLYKDYK